MALPKRAAPAAVGTAMRFEIAPFGVNATFLCLKRNGGSCVLTFEGCWNGLARLDYLVSPSLAVGDPHAIFRTQDIGWDGDGFRKSGRAEPLLVDPALVDELGRRGLVAEAEAEQLLMPDPAAARAGTDTALMLRAALAGCRFDPVYERSPRLAGAPPPVLAGFALRLLSAPGTCLLEARAGLPVLDPRSRAALLREIPRG